MNIIEQNLFTLDNVDEAMNLIVPPDLGIVESIVYKSKLYEKLTSDKIVFRANSMLIQHVAPAYFTFFLYYLTLSGEDTSIISTDNGILAISHGIWNSSIPRDIDEQSIMAMQYSTNCSAWLAIKNLRNPTLKISFDNWDISKKLIINNDYYMQLLPADTTKHLDELYRVISAYA